MQTILMALIIHPALYLHTDPLSGHYYLYTDPRVAKPGFDQDSLTPSLPRWLTGKESAYHCRRCRRLGFDPRAGNPLVEEMASYSSILFRKIPWTEEPGRL